MYKAHLFRISVSFRLTNKPHLSLLVLKLRNKRLQLLTQRRKLEGSNAQRKDLRDGFGYQDLVYNYRTYKVGIYVHVMLKCSLAVSLKIYCYKK